MKFESQNGQKFELTILRREFPFIKTEEDSEWLMIKIEVIHPKGSWKSIDSCLLTYEVSRLANWLEQISNDNESNDEESFIEPNLIFR